MTVGELAARSGRSLQDLVTAVLSGRVSSSTPVARAEPASATQDVRRGGLHLSSVVAALAGIEGPAKLDDVRGKVGGSQAQVRAALQKLAAAGTVRITGERRGTRYEAV
jgi:hypothetical protein